MCMQHVKPPLARRSRISVGSGSSIITAVGIAAGVAIISPSSALPFFWYLGLCVISYWIFFGRVRPEVIWLYCAYSIGVIVLYLIQNYELPAYIGFSGGRGVGTDDCKFWIAASEGVHRELPAHCYNLRPHPFTYFLRFTTPFPLAKPLDLLFVCAWGMALLPPALRRLTFSVTGERRAAWASFWFMATCLYTAANGLVLIRDAWVALSLVASLLFFYERRYVLLSLAVGFGFFLRPASGLLIVASVCILAAVREMFARRDQAKRLSNMTLVSVAGLAIAVAVLYAVIQVSGAKLGGGGLLSIFYREDFLEGYLARQEESILVAILRQPLHIRIPLSYVFFLGGPYFQVEAVVQETAFFVPRLLMYGGLFPFIYIWAFAFMARGAFVSFSRKQWMMVVLFIVLSFLTISISQASMQYRHKVLLLPLIYLFAGYGFSIRGRSGRWAAVLAGLGLAAIQLYSVL